jgi:dolichol-phosphate mannosyltransferase
MIFQNSTGIEISVVVPVYEERAAITPFLRRLEPVIQALGSYEVIFCVDPSEDGTEEVIDQEIKRNPRIGMIVFSRRFGQPAATMAGILRCRGKTCVVIDVDLQDPPELIPEMFKKMKEGFDVVYAKRRSRKGETFFKLAVSSIGYKLINTVSDVKIPVDTGDFRILTRRVIEHLRELRERHGFLRGLVAYVGFRQSHIEYDRDARTAGIGKYNRFFGSLKIGLNGLLGFSNFLLSISFVVGLAIVALSVLVILYVVVAMFLFRVSYPLGVPTIVALIVFMGGVQLISVGILGEYVGRIYDEVKGRPPVVVDREVNVKPL